MGKRTIVAALLLLAFATPAAAAEGSLEIFPDLIAILSEGRNPLQSHFLQLIALFVLLVVPVNQLVLKPLLRVLEERSSRIDGTRRRANEVGGQADSTLARYQSAVEEARRQAGDVRKETLETARAEQLSILADARKAAEAEVSAARSGMGRALETARAGLRKESAALAAEVATRVLGRPLS